MLKNRNGLQKFGTNHSKMMIVDDTVGAVMSWNMDGRSMGHVGYGKDFPSINSENALFFRVRPQYNYHPVIGQLVQQFEHDKQYSRPVCRRGSNLENSGGSSA